MTSADTDLSLRVYLDTSVISFYVETRDNPQAMFWRGFTRQLLDIEADRFVFFISDLVVAELAQGEYPGRDEAIVVAARFARLPVDDLVISTAEYYRSQFLAPSRPPTDSLHLALASVHRMDVLATWNFKHLANPSKRAHLRVLNGRLGLPVPDVVSPLDILEVEP